MIRKLSHRLVALTGRLGSGKSHISHELAELAKHYGVTPVMIDAISDLYSPYDKDSSSEDSLRSRSRKEISEAVAAAHADLGSDAGTILLLDYLQDRPCENTLYILDSKRTPSSIISLKESLPNALVIGVWAPDSLRMQRVDSRAAERDKGAPFSDLDAAERNQFDIDACLMESDTIIENDKDGLPYRLPLMILNACRHLFEGDSTSMQDSAHLQPTAKVPRFSSSPPPLSRTEMRVGISDLVSEYGAGSGTLFVVVQGGNEYISHLIRSKTENVLDIKLSSLSKQPLGMIVSTALSPKERIRPISDGRSLGEALSGLNPWQTPFSSVAVEGDACADEFAVFLGMVNDEAVISSPPPVEPEIYEALTNTRLGMVIRSSTQIVFVDDILYRGRTAHTAWSLLRLLGVANNPWKFVALCPDKTNPVLNGLSERVTTLYPDRAYTFENCPLSSDGYWDFVGDRFEYRNMSLFREYLSITSMPTSREQELAAYELERIIGELSMQTVTDPKFYDITKSLLKIFTFEILHNPSWVPSSADFMDQRSNHLGWTPFFLEFWAQFIAQDQPLGNRAHFKRNVGTTVQELWKSVDTSIFQDMVDLAEAGMPILARKSIYSSGMML